MTEFELEQGDALKHDTYGTIKFQKINEEIDSALFTEKDDGTVFDGGSLSSARVEFLSAGERHEEQLDEFIQNVQFEN